MEKLESVNCSVVRDLLPLYADGVLSRDSAALVDAHLPQCPPCTAELETLRRPVPKKKKNARQSLKATRRKLVAALAAAMLLVTALLFVGFKVMPPSDFSEPIAYYDGLFEPIFAFHATEDSIVGEGDFLKVQLTRHPRFEYNGGGAEMVAEDVVTMDGKRVGVAYIQIMQDPFEAKASERKANKNGGTNPMIAGYGYGYVKLLPMSEADKEQFRSWETGAGVDISGIDESKFASWARDIPITRLYYYGGPTKNLLNEALGWSERNGVLQDSVLLWDAQTGAWREDYQTYPMAQPGETTTAIAS